MKHGTQHLELLQQWWIQRRGGGGEVKQAPPLKLDQLCCFLSKFCIRMLKNKAQIARKSIKTSLHLPGPATPAESEFGFALVMCVQAHNLLRPPPPIKILDPPVFKAICSRCESIFHRFINLNKQSKLGLLIWKSKLRAAYIQAWDREKSKKEENCYMWGSAATEPPGGGFGRGVPPPAENCAILGTENHVLMQRKIKKRGKLLHVRERSDRTSWGWVREGGSPSRRKFCNFRYWNHVLMHFRTTFWGYNVNYLLCLVTLQLKMMIFFFLIFFFFFFLIFFFFFFFWFFFFWFFFFFLRMSKSAEIRGSAEKSHACI